MARYIDADELLKYKGQAYDENGVGLYAVGTGDILRMPTADVREVVHCSQCRWSRIKEMPFDRKFTICDMLGIVNGQIYPEDFFCGFGERREDG